MADPIKVLDVVALTEDRPNRGSFRGQIGTVVEELSARVYEVEFSDNDGRTYASVALKLGQLMVLHHEPVQAAQLRDEILELKRFVPSHAMGGADSKSARTRRR